MDLRVVHSIRTWLGQTAAWLDVQVRHAEGVESLVVSERVANLDQFPQRLATQARPEGTAIRLATRHPRWHRWQWDRFLARQAHRFAAVLVHSHFGNQGWLDLPAVRRQGLPHVVSFYGFDASLLPAQDPVWRDRYGEVWDAAALVLAEGPHMAATLRVLGAPASAVQVHHLGVDLGRLEFRPPVPPRPGRPLRILMAGRFVEKKGFPDGLRAAGLLGKGRPVEVTLVGAASGNARGMAESAHIEAAIAEGGLRVRRPGFLTHDALVAEARRHDVFLAPSRRAADGDTEGGAPVVLMEMAALGLPVVATRHCDIPNVLPAESRPYLAPEGDAEALAEALRNLVDAPEAWDALAAAQRRHIEQAFDARRQGAELARRYRGLLMGAGQP